MTTRRRCAMRRSSICKPPRWPFLGGDDGDIMTTENRDEVTVALTEAKTKLAELSLALKDETARADKAETELVSLRDWKTKREAKDLEERVELAFETYKDARKLTDADKEAMLIVLTA